MWFMKQVGFKPGVKREGVIGLDEQSGESKEEEVVGEGVGEAEFWIFMYLLQCRISFVHLDWTY